MKQSCKQRPELWDCPPLLVAAALLPSQSACFTREETNNISSCILLLKTSMQPDDCVHYTLCTK